MHRRILVGIPILAAALVFFGLWLANRLTVPSWKSGLSQYMVLKASPAHPITAQKIIRADQPWKFTSDMSADTYGACINFQSSYCYNTNEYAPTPPVLFTPGCLWCALGRTSIRDLEMSWKEFQSAVPLPFPPEDLWCALVKTSTSGEEPSWVVYIAKHQDLYSAAWIVHESSRSITDPQLNIDLKQIGCGSLLKPDK
jgi:hypothetical protein